ncbi:MAG: peptidoglycan D,D-transpeptidase FtsI family protein [Agathobacter sp.]
MAKEVNKRKKPALKFSKGMRKKLMVLFTGITFLFCALIGRLMYINYTSGEKYKEKVLSMQSYDSTTIPYQRGDILDSNGTVLATSVAVYNVIMDCSVMNAVSKVDGVEVKKYVEPTIKALLECFPDLEESTLRDYLENRPDSKYIILKKKLSYEEIQPFINMQEAVDEKGNKINPNIKGVWFEKEFQRYYPFDSLASSVIGFVSSGNVGTIGLENYYNSTLNGINGREYGYLNSDSDFEKTIIAPTHGNTLVTTIDANIQSIVEKKIKEFNDTYRDNYTEGDGSSTTAVIIMNPNTGEILAMAENSPFDLNNPRDLTGIMTEEEKAEASNEEILTALNKVWRNYCISETYEPGSVQKPFTIASGLETGQLNVNMTFECDGHEVVGGHRISCVKTSGHGLETLEKTLMDSCNDAIMQMSYLIGTSTFTRYQSIFNFGQKTGIDLPGEADAAGLIYTEDNMTKVDLATNAFGQNYNTTMIQMASAFASVINGGYYYQPYLVKKVLDSGGKTISTTEPTLLKQTISNSTSAILKEYLYSTVTSGTGKTAKVDGYSMGGKTGTAEKLPRGNKKYLVSFAGFVPYDNPQLMIYCVVDEPNSQEQDHSYYAQNIVREILEEVLPYMNIFPDEELTGINKDLGITGTDRFYNKKTQ